VRYLSSVFVSLTLVACSTTTTSAGERVRVTKNRAEVAQCRYLGKVHVEGPVYTAMGGFVGAAGDRANMRKNKTAEMGGDTLLRTGEDEDDAYDCTKKPAPAMRKTNNPNEVSGCQDLGWIDGQKVLYIDDGDTFLTMDGKTGTAYDCSKREAKPAKP
jgi:hypothetical protein